MKKRHQLKFRRLSGSYVIVRLAPDTDVPAWAAKGDSSSITRTADELSIVCAANNLPKNIDAGMRWICFKLEGPFSFSQTGVLLSLTNRSPITACPSSQFPRTTPTMC